MVLQHTISDPFARYLAAKKTVDDRALNLRVWQQFTHTLAAIPSPRVVEFGAGIGTMPARLLATGSFPQLRYTGVDHNPILIAAAQQTFATAANADSFAFVTADLYQFLQAHAGQQWDAIIAHAFLDLLDMPTAQPQILGLLRPGGLYYFTINFDGATILQPTVDKSLDTQIEQLYHQTMDRRLVDGKPSGDSQSGRHLFHQLQQAGASILAAGSSDWVVFAQNGRYPADEAYFLQFIIETMANALANHPALDAAQFQNWVRQRQAQIARGELVYIAHQLDFFGELPAD